MFAIAAENSTAPVAKEEHISTAKQTEELHCILGACHHRISVV